MFWNETNVPSKKSADLNLREEQRNVKRKYHFNKMCLLKKNDASIKVIRGQIKDTL